MKLVTLSDLHIGKWGTYGLDMLEKAESMRGDVLWLNGDIIEPGNGVDERAIFTRIGKMKGNNFEHIVWVAGNNCLELDCVSGSLHERLLNLSKHLGSEGIVLLDEGIVEIRDHCLVGSIGWYNGDLWVESSPDRDWETV